MPEGKLNCPAPVPGPPKVDSWPNASALVRDGDAARPATIAAIAPTTATSTRQRYSVPCIKSIRLRSASWCLAPGTLAADARVVVNKLGTLVNKKERRGHRSPP